MKRLFLGTAAVGLFLGIAGKAKAEEYSFTTFDAPGSTATNPLGGGINDADQIVGSYDDIVNGITHGYLLRHGRYTPLDFPDAILTRANAINDLGQIVGMYRDAGDILHGFLRMSDGKYSPIDFPGAGTTTARGINPSGLIVGGYDQAPGMIFLHGFLRMSDGKYSPIDFPGAVGLNEAQDINDPGQIVGRYDDADGIRHGFLLSGDSYTTLDPPGSTDTIAWKINDCGLIVGTYVDAGGSNHGFLATPSREAGTLTLD